MEKLSDRGIFFTLREPQVLSAQCRQSYNRIRPHSLPGYVPPAPESIRPRGHVLARLPLMAAVLVWVALANRQMWGIPDPPIHLGLPVSIRAGGFPPEFPWNPGVPAPYHYGADMLTGLRITASETGDVYYQVHEAAGG